MADATFTIGAAVACSDGPCGAVSRVVVDPVAQEVTHLVVEPEHRSGLGRLVPLDLVETGGGEVRLRCTLEEFEELPHAEETDFLPGGSGYQDYAEHEAYYWPYYGLEGGLGADPALANASGILTRDTLPPGEVGVRRGEECARDRRGDRKGRRARRRARDGHVTHVLLEEGHLWGRKQVAIPISAVARMDGGDQREPDEARDRGPPAGHSLPSGALTGAGLRDSRSPSPAPSDAALPAVQWPQQGRLLALVTRHTAEDVVEHDDRLVDVGALVEHHALRPLRHGGIGHLGPRGLPGSGQVVEHLRRPDDREMCRLAHPQDLLLQLGKSLVTSLDGQVAPSDHHARRRGAHGVQQDLREAGEGCTGLDLQDSPSSSPPTRRR